MFRARAHTKLIFPGWKRNITCNSWGFGAVVPRPKQLESSLAVCGRLGSMSKEVTEWKSSLYLYKPNYRVIPGRVGGGWKETISWSHSDQFRDSPR